ncbi:MAG: MATE family efflux transporter [Phocaeicola sp.]
MNLEATNELGTVKISKLLLRYAIPAIIAMTAASLYNMVDSIFIGHGVGPLAISGLAVTFPLMNLAAAFGSLVGMGASTLISVKLGQKDYGTAQKILGNVIILKLITGFGLTLVTLLALDPILYFFGASPDTISYARDYMQIILLGNVVTHTYFGLNAILRSTGHPRKAMCATIVTVLINTLLDPLFIYVFEWGIRGAAIATVVAQTITLFWQFMHFTDKSQLIHLRKGIYKLQKPIVTHVVSIGLAPFLMNLGACLIVIVINKGLKAYEGDLAIGAFGIVNRIVFLFAMVVMGLNQAMQPIAGYNFGAKAYARLNEVLKLTIYLATAIMTFGFLVGMFLPSQAVSIFTKDPVLIELGSTGLRIATLMYPIVGFQMVTSNFFQSIGMANKAIFLSLTRQILFLLPCLLILPLFLGVNGIWYSLPIADSLASLISGVMLYRHFKHSKKQIAGQLY